MDLGILLLAIALGVVLLVPKAHAQDTARFGIRNQNGLVHEPGLFFQNGQDLVIDGLAEFACLSWFGVEFYDSCIHGEHVGNKVKGTVAACERACLP
jgi:hypothetical protein